jgi:hypothetical protein
MKIRHLAGVLLVMGTLLLLAAFSASCTPDKTAPTLEGEAAVDMIPTEDAAPSDDLDIAANIADNIEPFSDQECLDCHTDQALLVELALPEEETEKLSSGPG